MASGSASATGCANSEVQVSGLSQIEMESSVDCLINEERATRGLAALRPNDELRRAALDHSNEMVAQSYFEHTSPAGVTFVHRIVAAGYPDRARSWSVGENLLWGSKELSTPQSVVTEWMNSPKHRANLLAERFREIGTAAVLGTPESGEDHMGVTVSSEFGHRVMPKKGRGFKARKAGRRG